MRVINYVMIYAVISLSACSPIFYSPNTHNVPLLSQKGETNLTVAGNGNVIELKGAYAVADHFAIQANGGFYIPKDLDNGNGGSGKFIDVGAGYFKPVKENFVFETYGILGFGTFENHFPSTVDQHPSTKGNVSANIIRYGIQPNFGYKSKYISAAVSSRFIGLNYNSIKGDLIFEEQSQVDYLKQHRTHFLIEPALTLRGGLERLKLQVQAGYSFNLNKKDFRQDESFITIGLNYNFK